jgi:hypothetical protein
MGLVRLRAGLLIGRVTFLATRRTRLPTSVQIRHFRPFSEGPHANHSTLFQRATPVTIKMVKGPHCHRTNPLGLLARVASVAAAVVGG